jgi:hypothetical protein
MTDKELLTLAAKAAGIEGYWFENEYWNGIIGSHINGADTPWNPLTSDSDALRLAVELAMCIETRWNGGANAGNPDIWFDDPVYGYQEGKGKNDLYAATRRAIVRAAAEIGRGMG